MNYYLIPIMNISILTMPFMNDRKSSKLNCEFLLCHILNIFPLLFPNLKKRVCFLKRFWMRPCTSMNVCLNINVWKTREVLFKLAFKQVKFGFGNKIASYFSHLLRLADDQTQVYELQNYILQSILLYKKLDTIFSERWLWCELLKWHTQKNVACWSSYYVHQELTRYSKRMRSMPPL